MDTTPGRYDTRSAGPGTAGQSAPLLLTCGTGPLIKGTFNDKQSQIDGKRYVQ